MERRKLQTTSLLNDRPLIIKLSFILLVTLIFYWQDLSLLFKEAFYNDLYSYIIAIPFLLAYIIYRIRKTVKASIIHDTYSEKYGYAFIIGLIMFFIAALLKWVGAYTFFPLEFHMISMPIFIASLVLIFYNFVTLRYLIFPIAFLSLLVPPPVLQIESLGAVLSVFSSQTSYIFLKTIGLPVTISETFGSPTILLTTTDGTLINFSIDLACSGLYSLIGFFIFSVFLAYIIRSSIKNKILFVVFGFPLIYSLNIIRITLIIIIGYLLGPNLALNVFHTTGGWILIFIGTILLMFFSQRVLNINIFHEVPDECSHIRNNQQDFCMKCGKVLVTIEKDSISKDDVAKFILLILLMIPLLYYQVPVFTIAEGVPGLTLNRLSGGNEIADILPQIDDFTLMFNYRDRAFENLTGQDVSTWYAYASDVNNSLYWVGLEIGPSFGCLHRRETCLVSYPRKQGWELEVEQLDLRDIHLTQNPPISARYFAYRNMTSDHIEVDLYWRFRTYFQTLEGFRSKWVQISVIVLPLPQDNITLIEENILPIAMKIIDYWNPASEWLFISLLIAQHGITLLTLSGIILTVVLMAFYYSDRKERLYAKNRYDLLSVTEDRWIVDSVKKIEKEVATEDKIVEMIKGLVEKDIDIDMLHLKLIEAKEAGLITRAIFSINDEPYIGWKTRF